MPVGTASTARRDSGPERRHGPMNVIVAPDSAAERAIRARTALPDAEALAPGLPATPTHDLHYHGGKIIADLSFTNVYVGGAAAWQQADITSIDHALAAAMSDTRLNRVVQQYFHGQPTTSAFRPSRVLPGSPPAVVSQGDAENIARSLLANGALAGLPLPTTVVNLMLPRGAELTTDLAPTGQHGATAQAAAARRGHADDAADSHHGLGGYHGSIHTTGPDGMSVTVYYAVGVYSEALAGGGSNGIVAFDTPWKNVVATFYHELNEARTDADVEDANHAPTPAQGRRVLGWVSRQGEEIGDFPVFEARPLSEVFQEVPLADGSGSVPIQFMYSNAVHGPERPT